uniref:Uncharacterized protein n=1 Tax=Plectus sambesii TaxID=2011161 RepID=A0A914UU70_9BILA
MRHQNAFAGHPANIPAVPQDRNYTVEYSDPMTADIAERLQRLKAARQGEAPAAAPSQTDIESRLANLRNVDVSEIRNPGKMFEQSKPQPKQTPHDLITQAKDEAALETKWDPAHDVARRLAHLRDEEYNPSPSAAKDEVNPSAYLDSLAAPATELDRSGESDDSVMRNAAEVDELLKRAQRETQADAQSALAGLQNDAQVQQTLANIRQQTRQQSMKDDEISKELAAGRWNRDDDISDDGSDKELGELAERIIKEAELEDAAEQEEVSPNSGKKHKKERPLTPDVDEDDEEDP